MKSARAGGARLIGSKLKNWLKSNKQYVKIEKSYIRTLKHEKSSVH